MTRNIIGFVLIDTPHSALNNAGPDMGARTENIVKVKTIRKGRLLYPYVSAQAWRYWWRKTLVDRFKWVPSPITYIKKAGGKGNQAFTAANPFSYPDDDVFGYMRALKQDEQGTLTRLSPLKTSPLISVFEQIPVVDWGTMSRQEDHAVPYERQFYSTIMKGIFSLDITSVGIFYEHARSGFKNLDAKHVDTDEIKKAITSTGAKKGEQNGVHVWGLPQGERVTRCKQTIEALPYLSSTTGSAHYLTDVTPQFIILAVFEGGNHIFMNITNEDRDRPVVNFAALREVLTDYKENIKSDVYVGRSEGFLDDLAEGLKGLVTVGNLKVMSYSPKEAVEKFAATIKTYIT